jgi:hypothetical protein
MVAVAKHGFVSLVGSAIVLAACTQPKQDEAPRGNVMEASKAVRVEEPQKPAPQPVFAVNELANGLIPLAPQMGRLAVRNECIVFTIRDRDVTPLWPAGSTLESSGGNLIVRLAGGAGFKVPSAATLAGAFVPLNSANMTKYSKRLPDRCPGATFAVARP